MTDPYSLPEPEPSSTADRSAFLVPLVSLVAILALVIGVAAVVSDDDDDGGEITDPIALLEGAPDAAREAGSARMRMSVEMGGEGMSFDMTGEGLVDFATGASTFSMSMMGMSFEMITDGETLWMKLPSMARPAGITEEWVAVPVAGGMGSSPFPGTTGGAGILDALRGLSSEIEELGSREVNGVDANGYRVTVDLRRAIEEVPSEDRAEAEAALEQLQQLGTAEMPIEVWITDDGLPVRMIMDMSAQTLFQMHMQLDFTDFGVPIEITPPPAEDVRTIDDPSMLDDMFGGMDTAEAA